MIDDQTRFALRSAEPTLMTYSMERGDERIAVKNIFTPLVIKGRRWGQPGMRLPRRLIGGRERLLQVRDQVGGIFQADVESHQQRAGSRVGPVEVA